MPCTDNIVTISTLCDDNRANSLSGFDLMDAPEISISNLAQIANETYVTGLALAQAKLKLSIIQVKNDFIGALNANGVTTDIVHAVYDSSDFNITVDKGLSNYERGVTIHRSYKLTGKLTKTKITTVSLYPLTSADSVELKLIDNNLEYTYTVALIANQVNTFTIDHTLQGSFARIVVSNAAVNFASAYVKCGTGCNGSMPNDCAYAKGYNGIRDTDDKEGYGINVKFTCECDYEELLCDLAKTYVGELIWLKARFNILDEQVNSNRFDNWIVYGQEAAINQRGIVDSLYREKWNMLMAGIFNILKRYKDSCLDCRGIKRVVNL